MDYDTIRRHPKILVGYSDITALMMALYRQSGLITFHGPMMARLPSKPEDALKQLYDLLGGKQPVTIHGKDGRALLEGRAQGPVVGGNLSLLCHMLGTPFFPRLDGAILLLEDKGEALYRLDRMLTHLMLAGQLSNLAGVVGGQFLDCGPINAVNGLIKTTFSKNHIPVVTGFPVGHGSENMTIPMGIRAELDTHQMTLSTLEPHVVMT
jgi:muramoyltetrapeptide carboxypeptidase